MYLPLAHTYYNHLTLLLHPNQPSITMNSPLLPETDSPYRAFRRGPNECDEDGNRPWAPMTMIDRDGSILFETEFFDLRSEIIRRNYITAP